MPFIIEVQDCETGKTKYVTGGEWSDYSLDNRVAAARHFKTREEVYRDVMTVDVEYALVPGTKE